MMSKIDWKRYIPLWSVLVFMVIVAGMYLYYQTHIQVDVVKALTGKLQAQATLESAKAPFYENLPNILLNGTIAVLGFAGAIVIASFGLSWAVRVFLWAFQRGYGVYHETPAGRKMVVVGSMDSLVAAHAKQRLGAGVEITAMALGGGQPQASMLPVASVLSKPNVPTMVSQGKIQPTLPVASAGKPGIPNILINQGKPQIQTSNMSRLTFRKKP